MGKGRKINKCNNSGRQLKKSEAPEMIVKKSFTSKSLADDNGFDAQMSSAVAGENEERDGQLLPSYFPWIVALVTSVLRAIYVSTPENWWILHPDEIFQSMEVAHSEVYGYGLRPYEFMGPASHENLSHYQLVEKELGMQAMRSPLMAQFYMLVSALGWALGLHVHPYLMWRLSHVIITSCLPVAVARFAVACTASTDVGNVAAALTALSSHLNLFGTHTLVNSFLSPFLFWTLADAVRVLSDVRKKTLRRRLLLFQQYLSLRMARHPGSRAEPATQAAQRIFDSVEVDSVSNEDTDATNVEFKCPNDRSEEGAKSRENSTQSSSPSVNEMPDVTKLISGLVMAVTVYVRPDAILMASIVCSSHLYGKSLAALVRNYSCIYFALGGMVGILLAMVDDFYFYGSFTLSPVNWVKFNVFSGKSGHLFGESDFTFYFRDPLIYTLSICYSLILMFDLLISSADSRVASFILGGCPQPLSKALFHLKSRASSVTHLKEFRRLSLSAAALLALYSYASHKERRFLHDVIVLLLTSAACVICAAASTRLVTSVVSKRTVVMLILAAFAGRQWVQFQAATKSPLDEWPYQDGDRDYSTNECLHFISKQNDVTGVFMEKSLIEAGSFTMLHKNVPMLFTFGKMHVEFDGRNMIMENRSCFMSDYCSVGYYSLNNVADLIHERNSEYLKKKIIESAHYNYAIVSSNKEFFYPAFVKVLARKNMSVWRRVYDAQLESAMAASSSKIPYGGLNSTVIELEAEVLKQMGNYHTAMKKFRSALALGNDKVEIYASMAFCCHRMGLMSQMNQILQTCVQKYSRENCLLGAKVRVTNMIMSGANLSLK
ncbi:hypothetical protein Btru_035439 [Bulinus truncatus]|nr:hypothetical protein Btru_035439 [Bulinus truncatus]